MIFAGRVRFRSSLRSHAPSGPPGEAEIQRLNRARVERVLAATGWDRLAPGTLNLEVPQTVVGALALHIPILTESAGDITYPPAYDYIPKMRRAVTGYFEGRAHKGSCSVAVLVRRAEVPVKGIVELLSSEQLTEKLGLAEGECLAVELLASEQGGQPDE